MRLFAAIELDPAIRRKLTRLQTELALHGRGIRWVGDDQMHLTVKFLGEVPDADVPAVCEMLREIAQATSPFEFSVEGVGCFPPAGSVRVIWAGLSEPSGRLAACRDACEARYADLGFKPERRGFTPHLTLARVKQASLSSAIRAAVTRRPDFSAGRQCVHELVMFESQLRREGAEYVPVCRCELGGGEPGVD